MKKAIEQCMVHYEIAGNGEVAAHFVFPDDFIGFQGHFPGNKILPGICQIQCAIAMIEKWKGKSALVKEIILAKFLSPVFPLEELLCAGRDIEESNGAVILKVSIHKGSIKTAEMKLKVQFREDGD